MIKSSKMKGVKKYASKRNNKNQDKIISTRHF